MTKSVDVGTLLQFTSDDLALNRQGKLSPGQIARLRAITRAQRIYYLLILGFVVILSIVMNLVFSTKVQPGVAFAMVILSILIVVVCAAFIVYFSARAQRKLAQGTVNSARGKVSSFKYRKNRNSSYRYYVKVENVLFRVSDSLFAAFHNGHSYIVYYVPLMRMTIVAPEEVT